MPGRLHVHQVLISTRVGGGELVAAGIAARLGSHMYAVQGWTPGHGPAFDLLRAAGVVAHTYSLERLNRGGVAQALELAFTGCRWTLARGIVHIHDPTVYGLFSPVLQLLPVRAIVHFHIDPTAEQLTWALRRPPAAIIACSHHTATVLGRHGVAAPVRAVPNAVDLSRFARSADRAAAKRRLGVAPERPLIVDVGNLAETKGQLTAVRAAAILRDSGRDHETWLVGEEREPEQNFTARLEAEIAALGLGGVVKLLGFRSDLPEVLMAADVVVLPSSREGLPLVVMEAQAAEVPVVASPLPGVRELIDDGVTGILAPADDPAAYAGHVVRLLDDEPLRRRLTGNALAKVRAERSWDTFVGRITDIYRELTE